MMVYAVVNQSTDIPYWFARETFYEYSDQKDFLDRDIKEVQAAYLADWFDITSERLCRFYIPAVSAIYSKTDLMGSRHRLAVLLPYLYELPIVIATAFLSPGAQEFLNSVPKRLLDHSQPLCIPEFPICEKLP
jgi:hypothetical protein